VFCLWLVRNLAKAFGIIPFIVKTVAALSQ